MREKPENADYYDWEGFNKKADEDGIGEACGDWETWWDFWRSGYSSAMNLE